MGKFLQSCQLKSTIVNCRVQRSLCIMIMPSFSRSKADHNPILDTNFYCISSQSFIINLIALSFSHCMVKEFIIRFEQKAYVRGDKSCRNRSSLQPPRKKRAIGTWQMSGGHEVFGVSGDESSIDRALRSGRDSEDFLSLKSIYLSICNRVVYVYVCVCVCVLIMMINRECGGRRRGLIA